MSPDEYIKTRLDDQLNWMDAKSVQNQKAHTRLTIAQIVVASIIPVLAGLDATKFPSTKIVMGILGATVAIIAGVSAVMRYQSKWIGYRVGCESLKREKYAFLAGIAPFDGPDAFKQLVTRTESVLAKENFDWADQMKPPPGK
jgi:hypothetical protein